MTKRTKVILIVCAVITVLAVAAGITAVWFFSDGIHILGPVAGISIAHIDIDTELYAYDKGFTGEKTRLRVSGTGIDRRSWSSPNVSTSSFDGDFEVSSHPVVGDKLFGCFFSRGQLWLHCQFIGFDSEEHRTYFEDGIYSLFANRERGDYMLYVKTPDGRSISYVPTQNAARAREILDRVLSKQLPNK